MPDAPASRLLVIANDKAGSTAEETVEAVLEVLRSHAEVEVARTSSPEDLDDLLTGTEALDECRVVVIGGDGSIHAVMAALHRHHLLGGVEVALVPMGTGNDFARTLGLPLDAVAAAPIAATGTARPADLVVDDTGAVTVNGVHVGASAEAGERGAAWKERLGRVGVGRVNLGKLGYPIGALLTAVDPPMRRLRVEVDGKVVHDTDHRVLMVALGNGASVGGGTELTPAADPHDGQVDVLIATPAGVWSRLRVAALLPFRRHPEDADVQMLRGSTITIAADAGDDFDVNSDGEIDGPVRRRTWRVLPGAYRVVVPGTQDAADPSA
ncbi:diacylglycerol/lipid kinase family protein [Nocardioides sambongensis]|uniref:diacylglycerol/lipid kinase family protein n=1 Tax=Nocardioides sambongensis TaxID=2589074 RepID=UPI001E3ED2CF|nr:diacylglycerol kinase family protein [Nocardioides sambongensis]